MKYIYIFLILFLIINIYYLNYNCDCIENFNDSPKKIVIFVATQNVKGPVVGQIGNFWGLGDIIRGMVKTYQICKELNYEFIIDIHLHPISKFFKKRCHKYEKLIDDNKDNIRFTTNARELILNDENEIVYFLTNDVIDYNIPLTEDCKNFIKDVFVPTDELLHHFNYYFENIPYEKYNILHYRLGDNFINNNKVSNQIANFINNFNKNKEHNDILMSDSQMFKGYIKNISTTYSLDLDIGHIGYEKDDTKIKNTLCEFLIMSKAEKLKTYSTYNWVFIFINIISLLYNIPIVNLKKLH